MDLNRIKYIFAENLKGFTVDFVHQENIRFCDFSAIFNSIMLGIFLSWKTLRKNLSKSDVSSYLFLKLYLIIKYI